MRRVARLLGVQGFFVSRLDMHLDTYLRFYWNTNFVMHFCKLFSILVAASVTAGTSGWLLFVDRTDPDKAAIAVTYSTLIPYFLGMACMVVIVTKTHLTSLERLLEYRVLPEEPAWHLPTDPADA